MAEPFIRPDDWNADEPEWDQLSIETPELVAIDVPVAGLGSRFVALFVDYLIWFVVIVGSMITISLVDPSLYSFSRWGFKWARAVITLAAFLVYWGYFTLFEAFWNGRTPGKRVAKIRVIQRSGRGIGLFESMTRNLLRIVDQFPFIYVVGAISILVTKQHQRLGDLAAGTLVVHERQRLDGSGAVSSGRTFTAGLFEQMETLTAPQSGNSGAPALPTALVQRLGAPDLEVLEGFFARRLDFSMETRALLAQRIAAGIRAKSGLEPAAGMSVETFLEEVARQLRDIARVR